jgi:UDP-N-acetyl-D-mannosaminuronate dehydrogenase
MAGHIDIEWGSIFMKITVAGTGYVGLSMAVVLSRSIMKAAL